MPLEYAFSQLEYIGVFDAMLPFILIFTIVFAIMQKVKIFGDPTKDKRVKTYNAVIALVMGAAVVYPHIMGYYPPDQDIVNIINRSLPNVSVIVVAVLMALILIGLLGKRFELGSGSASGWIAMAAFAIVLWVFGAAANWWSYPTMLGFIFMNPDLVALVIVILVFAMLIWWITKEDKPANEKPGMAKFAEEMLKGP